MNHRKGAAACVALFCLIILGACGGEPMAYSVSQIPAEPAVPPTPAPGPDPEATPGAESAPEVTTLPDPPVLPAPLYFLTEERQLGRIEPDAVTSNIITQETNGVDEFDVSPHDGTVLLITTPPTSAGGAASLVRTDAHGGHRRELLSGSIRAVHWSPDGARYAMLWEDGPEGSGIYMAAAAEHAPVLLVRNQPFDPATGPGRTFEPRGWSPDGVNLLLVSGPDNGPGQPAGDVYGISVIDMTGRMTEVIPPSGQAAYCGVPIWGSDSASLYCASVGADETKPALWRISITDGSTEELVRAEPGTTLGFDAVHQLDDGTIHALVHVTAANGAQLLRVRRLDPDGGDPEDLRPELLNETIAMLGSLWAEDGSGLVAQDRLAQRNSGLVWVPSDGGQMIRLPEGSTGDLRWGAPHS